MEYILTARCPSRLGTIDALTGFLAQLHCYVMEMASFDDQDSGQFFIRIHFRTDDQNTPPLPRLREGLAQRLDPFAMIWQLHHAHAKIPVLVMVSRFDHCLNDLLYRSRTGKLPIEIKAIVSNHADFEALARWHDIPYHHLPVTPQSKTAQESELLSLVDHYAVELVVLARYMQVLSEDLCLKMEGRVINIHHSLLPGFKGAKPYHRAYEYGVKLVGATAHYVTADLDEGPIIEQLVESVDHSFSAQKLIEKGQDTEAITLARAVKHHAEQRVFVNGRKTVVFR